MRRLLIVLLAVTTFSTGTAVAQSGYWAGFSVGYPGAALHFGLEDVAPSLAVRVNAGYSYIGNRFALGFDALYDVSVDTGAAPIDVYLGGGLGIGVGRGSPIISVNLLAGGEFRLIDAGLPQGGIYLEVGPSLSFNVPQNRTPFGVVARLGFNYHF